MRTTISIDNDLLMQAKQVAAATERSLSKFVEDAVREVIARCAQPQAKERVALPTVAGRRVPEVDYDSYAALLELTEEPAP